MRQKGFALIFIIIVLALVGIVSSYYFGSRNVNLKVTPTPTETPSPQETSNRVTTPTVKPTTDPTVNWKIYTNARFGYSIKFPDNLLRLICTGEELTATVRGKNQIEDSIDVGDCPRDGRYTLETKTYDSIQKEPEETKYYLIDRKNITLDGLPARQYTYTFTNIEDGPYPIWYTVTWVNKDNKTYEIYFDQKESLTTFDQILTTFKFVQ